MRREPVLVSAIRAAGAGGPPAGADGFYAPPAALPAEPGALVRAERTTVSLLPGWALPATDAWRLMYRSTSATGEPVGVTATLLVPWAAPPPSRDGGRAVVAYAVGGHGLGEQCTPSVQLHHGTQVELAVIAAHLAQGWAVVVTDYQRSPGHAFLNAAASAHAVLDAVRAARRVPGAGLDAGPVGIAGYGPGGAAAAAAAERHPAYAPELDLRGVTAGAAPANLAAVLAAADGTAHAGLVPAALAGLHAAYPDLGLEALTPAGRSALQVAARRCLPDVLDRWAGRPTAELVGAGGLAALLAAAPAWRARLDDQRLGRRTPRAPVLLYHGLGDPIVPYGVVHRLADDWRSRGADVQLAAYPVAVHGGALVEAVPQVHHWLGRHLAP
ncbi:MAG TPA: lipase family protein [Acidimicrobiales bacterium]